MTRKQSTLTTPAARAYYDHVGKMQDAQGFYEDPAQDDLIAHASFQESQRIFEFGCGTGKLAARLLQAHLPASATYLGCDISPVMIELAGQRLEAYSERAEAVQSNGDVSFPLPDHSVDRVISSYVLDLLSEEVIRTFFAEAHRVLMPGGKLCVVSLTSGTTTLSRIVSSVWLGIFRMRASLVGGCRPVLLGGYVDRNRWQQTYQNIVTPFGVPSEIRVLIARPSATA